MRQLTALRAVADDALALLAGRGRTLDLAGGERLIERDRPNTSMFVVVSGGLRVDLRDTQGTPLATLGVGETAGELSLIAHCPASATVTAEGPTRVFALDEETFYWLLSTSHGFTASLLVTLAERLRTNNDAVEANIMLRRHFEKAALHDALTGVHSRRWLDETLPRIVQRHLYSREPLSIAMLDVDHFKRINDAHGHPVGDAVLAELGRICREKLRPTDLVARAGGEEFVLILPQTPVDGSMQAAERLRKAVEAAIVVHGQKTLKLTVSIGVATLSENMTVSQILSKADQALYAAKQAGRNRIERWSE